MVLGKPSVIIFIIFFNNHDKLIKFKYQPKSHEPDKIVIKVQAVKKVPNGIFDDIFFWPKEIKSKPTNAPDK